MTTNSAIKAKRLDLLRQKRCPIHKTEMDLVFAGHGGSEYWCSAPSCTIGASYADDDAFKEVKRKSARGQK